MKKMLVVAFVMLLMCGTNAANKKEINWQNGRISHESVEISHVPWGWTDSVLMETNKNIYHLSVIANSANRRFSVEDGKSQNVKFYVRKPTLPDGNTMVCISLVDCSFVECYVLRQIESKAEAKKKRETSGLGGWLGKS